MNTRFREVAEGLTVEMIATRIELDYTPAGAGELTATWWGKEFVPLPGGHEQLGNRGDRLETRLSDYATTVLTVTDPVTGQEVSLSAAGWVTWAKAFYDHAHNAVNTPEPPPEVEEAEMEP